MNNIAVENPPGNENLLYKNKANQKFLLDFSEGFATYKVGDEFFHSLVQYVSDVTKMHYVFLGKLIEAKPNESLIKTFALSAFGRKVPDIEYALPHGPCEQVIRGTLYAYPASCKSTFPKNKTLVQFNVEGYIGYPLFDVKGNSIGLIAVMHETEIEDVEYISSLLKIVAKRAEFELERLHHEEELVKINRTLQEKNHELEKRNAELASFSYVASHDLQEPLRKIEAFTSRIMEKDEANISPKGKDYFKRIQKAAARGQRLIDDLLLYSRTNIAERKYVSTDLNALLASVKKELMDQIAEKDAVISSSNLPVLDVIEFQMRQLFTNLISNSLKFSRPGIPPQINISAQVVSADNIAGSKHAYSSYWNITFTDNGIGFEDQYADVIFSIFQRLHTREEYDGTGIGLTICRKIVENHDGLITAAGTPGQQATFNVFIPLE